MPSSGTEQGEGSGLLGKALGFGGAAVAGAMVLWRRKKDEQELDQAREEVAAEDRAHAVAKGERVEPPSLASDPVGFAADRGLRAGRFVEDHPFVSLGGGGLALVEGGSIALTPAQALVLSAPVVVGGAQVLSKSGPELPGLSLAKKEDKTADKTVNDIIRNPDSLSGKTPQEVEPLVQGAKGWKVETLGRGSQKGKGWVFREYGENGRPTGRLIKWHPGGGHHGPRPYWKVSSPEGAVSPEIR